MSNTDVIPQQQALLAEYRRNLAFSLRTATLYDGEQAAPLENLTAIRVQREQIRILKATLREFGATVVDEPNDVAPFIEPASFQRAGSLDQPNQDALLEAYQQELADLLLDRDWLNRGRFKVSHDDPIRGMLRTKTLTLVRQLDGSHNRDLIQFLRDAKLLDFAQTAGAIVDLRSIDLSHVDLTNAPLAQVDLSGAILCWSQLVGANLCEADLRKADLYAANLRETILYRANLHGANLCWSQLISADLERADLREADLRGAYLSETNLREANLREANLYGANLREANLREADLYGANLREANMCEADLSEANLSGADMRGANLGAARLTNTIMPDGTTYDPEKHGDFEAK